MITLGPMAIYRLFVDDSGTREYDPDRNYETSGRSRYFVYGSLLIEDRDASLFASRLQELKQLSFGQTDVEIKSNWLRIPHERKRRYVDRYGITDDRLSTFVDSYYRLVIQAPIRCIAAVVDKRHMQETYANPWYAPTAAYEVLLQRAVRALGTDDELVVTVDDISGRTPKRSEYRPLLSQHRDRLRKHGSILQRTISFACLRSEVRFMNSAHSDLLQVADVVAYNVHRQFRDFGETWEQLPAPGATLPTYEHFMRIARKFYCDDDGRIQGFGIVKFPLKQQVRWRLTGQREEDRKEKK